MGEAVQPPCLSSPHAPGTVQASGKDPTPLRQVPKALVRVGPERGPAHLPLLHYCSYCRAEGRCVGDHKELSRPPGHHVMTNYWSLGGAPSSGFSHCQGFGHLPPGGHLWCPMSLHPAVISALQLLATCLPHLPPSSACSLCPCPVGTSRAFPGPQELMELNRSPWQTLHSKVAPPWAH